MAERYRRILSIEEMYFQEESPILLEKAALLFDNQKEVNVFQGKFTNIQSKPIAALYIDIACFDISGKELGTTQGIYLDMDVHRNFSFGTNTPVEIPYVDARKFAFTITKIAYTNGDISEQTVSLHSIARVEGFQSNTPYMEQYIREIGLLNPKVSCRNVLVENKECWICPCGSLNAKKEVICRNCGMSIEKLRILSDNSYMNQRRMEYEEAVRRNEKLKQEEEAAKLSDIHNRNKKIAKVFSVCAVVLAVLFLLANYVVLPKYYSGEAEKYIAQKKFDSAEKTYQKITSSLRKSKEIDGYYKGCIKFLSENDIDNAEKCYEEFKDTEKAKNKELNDLWKKACINEAKNNNQEEMLLSYSHINNTQVLENEELNNCFLEYGKKLLINMEYKNAEIFLSKVTDEYTDLLENVYYESAKYFIENGKYMAAVNHCFDKINDEHMKELGDIFKNAFLANLTSSSKSDVFDYVAIKKYLTQGNISSIERVLYSTAKKNLHVNGDNSFSKNCFLILGNYKDSKDHYNLLTVIASENLTQTYNTLKKMKVPFAKKYLKKNKLMKLYKSICGTWHSNKVGDFSWRQDLSFSLQKGMNYKCYTYNRHLRKHITSYVTVSYRTDGLAYRDNRDTDSGDLTLTIEKVSSNKLKVEMNDYGDIVTVTFSR